MSFFGGNDMTAYLRFIKSKHMLVDEFKRVHGVDKRELHLLEIIGLKNEEKESLMITEVMYVSQCGSPAAIHRSLRILKDAGLVEVLFEGKNRRSKYLAVSEKTSEYFSSLGAALIEAADIKKSVKPRPQDRIVN
jgi:DNA-binding transcriptional ArsR family regulator